MKAFRCYSFSSPSAKYCGDRGLFCLRDSEICYLRPLTNLSPPLCKPLHKKNSNFVMSCSHTQRQPEIQDEGTDAYDITDQPKTVQVRFQMQRECSFGQQFYLVGDDPLLGQWDLSRAVPFNWSDGHVWTTELDIPAGKCIKFKFILKKGPDNIIWQPGPNRTLQTPDTQNTITVCEDWDSAELQNIIEVSTSNQIEESIINAEEIADLDKEVHIDKNDRVPDETLSTNDLSLLVPGLSPLPKTQPEEKSLQEFLVPGLSPLPKTQPEEKSLQEIEDDIFIDASIEADKSEELNSPEMNLEEVLFNDYKDQHHSFKVEDPEFSEVEDEQNPKSVDHVLKNDTQWGLNTLQNILASFGFCKTNRWW